MSTPHSGQPDKSQYLEEKARLECEKLKAEIESIRKPLRHSPSFYTALAPVLLAVLGILWSWCSGWFDVQRTRINNEKTMVEAQTERLRAERVTLDREGQEQRAHVTGLETEVGRLSSEKFALTNQIARLEKERNEMQKAKEFFQSEAKRLAGTETNSMRIFKQLQESQADSEKLASQFLHVQTTNIWLHSALARRDNLIGEMQNIITTGAELMGSGASRQKLQEHALRAKIFNLGHSDL